MTKCAHDWTAGLKTEVRSSFYEQGNFFLHVKRKGKEFNMAGKAPFMPPVIEDNPDGWGPCAIPTAFRDIPYQPFSKGDRLGKVNYYVVCVV